MYYSFFIHSSVNGHLGCFHVLAVVNSAVMNIGVHVSFSVLVYSGYMPRSGIAGSYGGFILRFVVFFFHLFLLVVVLVFYGISILSFIVAVSIYIPTKHTLFFCLFYVEGQKLKYIIHIIKVGYCA